MDNKYDTGEIIELLRDFVEFKSNIPYLNSYVGSVVDVEEINIETNYEESIKSIDVKIFIRSVKDFWLLNDFEKILDQMDSRHPRELVIMGDEDPQSNKKWVLRNVENFEQVSELEFSVNANIILSTFDNIETLKNKDMRKQDTAELFKIKFLNRVAGSLENDELVSVDVQKILLNQKKIDTVNIDDVDSSYYGFLDKYQRKAFKAALSDNDILIIKGPPGTGKSRVITQLLKHYTFEEKKQVILASQTHAALDNVIENISVTATTNNYTGIIWEKTSKGNVNREYASTNKMFSRNIRNRLEEFAIEGGELEKLLKTTHTGVRTLNRYLPKKLKFMSNVLFTTLASRGLENIQELSPNEFKNSILIIDEVSKLSIVDVLRFSMHAKKVILFGDDRQLPPIKDERLNTRDFKEQINPRELSVYKHLFEDSIFYKMFEEGFKQNIILQNTYRSPQCILDLYNEPFYKGKINSLVGSSIKYIGFKEDESRFGKAYTKDLILMENKLGNLSNEDYQIKEMKFLLNHLNYLNDNVSDRENLTVMVLFTYKQQYNRFIFEHRKEITKFKANFGSFKYGTIDQMQGQEAEVVYMLTSKSSNGSRVNTGTHKFINLLQTMQRINVGLSRAKNKIILFADINYISKLNIWDATTKSKTKHTWREIVNKFQVRIADKGGEDE